MNYKELIDAIACIVCYNGYEDVLKDISDYIKYYKQDEFHCITYPKKILKGYEVDKFPNIVWALIVIMFGDYGTSPRFGWINMKNKEKALAFLNSINRTYDPNYEDD